MDSSKLFTSERAPTPLSEERPNSQDVGSSPFRLFRPLHPSLFTIGCFVHFLRVGGYFLFSAALKDFLVSTYLVSTFVCIPSGSTGPHQALTLSSCFWGQGLSSAPRSFWGPVSQQDFLRPRSFSVGCFYYYSISEQHSDNISAIRGRSQ